VALKSLMDSYDAEHGGFTKAPKFPRPSVLNFLFRMYGHRKEGLELHELAIKAMDMTLVTLAKMARGGIYDHIGALASPLTSSFAPCCCIRCTAAHRAPLQTAGSTDTVSPLTGWSRSACFRA
jgi:hypothetical protein